MALYSGMPKVKDSNSASRKQTGRDGRRRSNGNNAKAVAASIVRTETGSTILEPEMVQPFLELAEGTMSEQPDLAQLTHRTRERKVGKVLLRKKHLTITKDQYSR
jgi:hypothetical protein